MKLDDLRVNYAKCPKCNRDTLMKSYLPGYFRLENLGEKAKNKCPECESSLPIKSIEVRVVRIK
jgi:DNA-directed RNA polymerase subunit RPC12/RpoP